MTGYLRTFDSVNGKSFKISRSSLDHIIHGEFSTRPLKDGKKSSQTVLKGGLHTYEGWVDFKQLHADDLAHLQFFDSRKHRYWYFARVLGNGVITLRIPRELFNSKASRITMYPDEYYKSGYLWKTLFPEGYTDNDILDSIEEALKNIDHSASVKGQIIGFCNIGEPLKEIRLTIQYRGEEILSAFPSWSQPNTGNDGKPYSHFDSIGFMIASSTEFFDDGPLLESEPVFCFGGDKFGIEKFVEKTPEIFKNRSVPSGDVSGWTESRESELKAYAESLSKTDLKEIVSYLTDISIIKNYPRILSGAYDSGIDCRADKKEYNAVIVYQNIVDGLKILCFAGESAISELEYVVIFLIDNMVTFTLFDLVIKRRILGLIIEIVFRKNLDSLSQGFILSLAKSPVRRELYIEYLPDTLARKRLDTPCSLGEGALMYISHPELSIEFDLQDYLEILKEHVGETYAFNFDNDFLNKHLYELLESQGCNYIRQVSDGLRYLQVRDLSSITVYLGDILDSLSEKGGSKELGEALRVIIRDYCRIQFAKRLRINGLYNEYSEYVGEVYEPVDDNLLYAIILKHERLVNSFVLGNFIDSIEKFAQRVSDSDLENDSKIFRAKIGKEVPPLPILKSLIGVKE